MGDLLTYFGCYLILLSTTNYQNSGDLTSCNRLLAHRNYIFSRNNDTVIPKLKSPQEASDFIHFYC